jgi:hypothetical protein
MSGPGPGVFDVAGLVMYAARNNLISLDGS